MLSEEHLSKVGGVGAIISVVVLIAIMLHPLGAPPGDGSAAFVTYPMESTSRCGDESAEPVTPCRFEG
jgi:hypothetical protein